LPFPLPGDLPDPGLKAASLKSPALTGRFLTTSAPQEALGQRNLEGYSLYGHKEMDTTEATLHACTDVKIEVETRSAKMAQ